MGAQGSIQGNRNQSDGRRYGDRHERQDCLAESGGGTDALTDTGGYRGFFCQHISDKRGDGRQHIVLKMLKMIKEKEHLQ